MFRSLFLLTAFLAITYGAVYPSDLIPEPEGRIVGGEDCKIEEAPYQVIILVDINLNGSFEPYCGGSIISNKFIVTAAHCTHGTKASQLKIRAGSANKNKGGQVISVRKIIQHKKYEAFKNDISLLLLTKKLIFRKTVSPIALPAQGAIVPDGSAAFATGWGQTSANSKYYPDILQKITIPIMKQDRCMEIYKSLITNGMLCAGVEQGGKSGCCGDSGGPLVVNKILIGITSFGPGTCAEPHFPEVYTRVPMYVDWIKNNIKI